MKHKKTSNNKAKKNLLVVTIGILFFFTVIAIQRGRNTTSWWQFDTKGEVNYSPISSQNKLFLTNNNGILYAIDKKIGNAIWTIRLPSKTSSEITPYKDFILVPTIQGELFCFSQQNGKEIWRFNTKEFSKLTTKPYIYQNKIFIGGADGILHVLDPKNGSLLWQFSREKISSIDVVETTIGINWFGSLEFAQNTVFYGTPNGILYALNPKDGKIRWEYHTAEKDYLTIFPTNKQLFLGTKSGNIYSVDIKTGVLVATITTGTSPIHCITNKPTDLFHRTSNILYVTTNDGKLLRYNPKNNSTSHIQTLLKPISDCPIFDPTTAFVTDQKGLISAVNLKTGRIRWQYNTKFPPSFFPIPYNWFAQLTGINWFNRLPIGNIIVFGNTNGSMYAIRTKSGKLAWQYNLNGITKPLTEVAEKSLYGTVTDGRLIKLNPINGQGYFPVDQHKLTFSEANKPLGSNQYHEITLNYNEKWFPNPWSQIDITTIFQQPDTAHSFSIKGFYYDKDTWKVRFNPPYKGTWQWTIHFKFPDGREIVKVGSFDSLTNTAGTYIHIDNNYPSKLTLDKNSEFNILGFQNTVYDSNNDGNPLNDWSLGTNESQQYVSSVSGNIFTYPSKTVVSLDDFLSTYSQSGEIFNTFRFGFGNGTSALFRDLGSEAEPELFEAKVYDEFFEQIRNHSLHLWLSLFSFNMPYEDQNPLLPAGKEFLKKYVEYVIARYGIYVDIWEIANETAVYDSSIATISQWIKSQDIEGRPVTINWEKPNHKDIDIISAHSYQSDDYRRSDLSIVNQIESFKKNNKPIVFSEYGNSNTSWDIGSLDRMRIKSWTAFFHQTSLIFWNQSDSKSYHSDQFRNGNIYIGPDERKQINILNSLTKNVPLNNQRFPIATSVSMVRGYGLKTTKETLGYFVCEKPLINFYITIPVNNLSQITWIDPQTGQVIEQYQTNRYNTTLKAPRCQLDLVLKITSS